MRKVPSRKRMTDPKHEPSVANPIHKSIVVRCMVKAVNYALFLKYMNDQY